MKLAPLLFAVPFTAALAVACGDPEEPNPPATIEPQCTEPVEVACADQELQDLQMKPNDVTAGAVTDEVVGDHHHAHIDASVGGAFSGAGYVYAKFTDDGLQRVELTDGDSFSSMDWDISFHRFVIRLNSGTGGPSCVTAAREGPSATFDTVADVSDQLTFNKESFMSDNCDLIADGSGLPGAPGTLMQNFWEYSAQQCLQMTGNVYVVQLADGHHVKVAVTNFYDDAAQAQCQEDGSLIEPHDSAQIQLDWAPLD